jgi:hypothetical protein
MRTGGKGRIRVNRDQALALEIILNDARHKLVVNRAVARDLGGQDLSDYQYHIKVVSDIQDELRRTIEEQGWLDESS